MKRLEHLLVHLHARHLVLHDGHLTGHAAILVALGAIPGNILGQNLCSVVLSCLGQALDLLHSLGLLALEALDLSLQLSVGSGDDALLFTGGLLRVDNWLFVSHFRLFMIFSRGVLMLLFQ